MKSFLLALIVVVTTACGTSHGRYYSADPSHSREEVAVIFDQFRQLNPPFSTGEAWHAFGKAKWIDTAAGNMRVAQLAGYVRLSIERGGNIFILRLPLRPEQSAPRHSHDPTLLHRLPPTEYVMISLRTTVDIDSDRDLRQFFHGRGPATARVVEYMLMDGKTMERHGEDNDLPADGVFHLPGPKLEPHTGFPVIKPIGDRQQGE